jgi:hypothetical protein
LDSSGDEALPNNSKPPLPDWAQSQNLSKSLQNQRLIDPDPIFGVIATCDLEGKVNVKGSVFKKIFLKTFCFLDIFKGSVNSKRLKKRSSSANWTGVDQLTQAEEQSYRKRMGYN